MQMRNLLHLYLNLENSKNLCEGRIWLVGLYRPCTLRAMERKATLSFKFP